MDKKIRGVYIHTHIHIHTKEYYSAIIKKETMSYSTMMNLQIITMLPQIQSMKNKGFIRYQIVFIKEMLFLRNKNSKLKI